MEEQIRQTQLESIVDRVEIITCKIDSQVERIEGKLKGIDIRSEMQKDGISGEGFVGRLNTAIQKLEAINDSLGGLLENTI